MLILLKLFWQTRCSRGCPTNSFLTRWLINWWLWKYISPEIYMNTRNLHGRTEFAWMHGVCMYAQNLHGRSTEIGQSGGASQWRVCHQWGLPCLVFMGSVTFTHTVCRTAPTCLFRESRLFCLVQFSYTGSVQFIYQSQFSPKLFYKQVRLRSE